MHPDIDRVPRIIRDTAAGEIMPRFRALAAGDVSEKRPGDLVTIADTGSEDRLAAALTALMPGSAVVGEEAADGDPDVLLALAGDAPVWVIDPLDGTRNFVDGKPCFAVIVAYCLGGRTLAAWIHDPVNDVTVWAADGEGAWIGDRRVRVAAPAPIGEMSGSLGNRLRKRLREYAGGAFAGARLVRYGCVGREYMDLAGGQLHFARYAGRIRPWDHAAGVLLHREAGGFSALVDKRSPYRPAPRIVEGTLMLAPDEATWDALHRAIGEG